MSEDLIRKNWIEKRIYLLREQKVILSHDLAELYEVEPRALIQAVMRNKERFPEDSMFQLSIQELSDLKSQIVISSWGGSRYRPYAFTEHGIAMLSSVLRSSQAIQLNIEIVRTFVELRKLLGRALPTFPMGIRGRNPKQAKSLKCHKPNPSRPGEIFPIVEFRGS